MQQALRDTQGIKPWTTIALGNHRSPREYCHAIKDAGMDISDVALSILPKVQCSQERQLVNLVKVPVGYFAPSACCGSMYTLAAGLGLLVSPEEVGLALMLQYMDHYVPKRLLIAMKAMSDPAQTLSAVIDSDEEEKSLFYLFCLERHCGRLQLTCAEGRYDTRYEADDTYLVFVRP